MSVNACLRDGSRVVFDEEGSYIENKTSGVRSWLERKNGMWTIKLWAQNIQGEEKGEDAEEEAETEEWMGYTRLVKNL